MREAAQWLIDTGRPMWGMDELTRAALKNPPEDYLVLYAGGDPAAACLLTFEDWIFWPDVPAGTSGFIHKLAVRRAFAGQGYAQTLIRHAASICADKGIRSLKLDCDPDRKGLCKFYQSAGFALKGIKTMKTRRWGEIGVALYEMELDIRREAD
jgi:ribosomal protein S18 acetylase RimI-like enzyme